MKHTLLLFFLCCSTLANVMAQGRTISGKVTGSEDNSALVGVSVILKGTTTGITTGVDGDFQLNVPAEGGTLMFKYIGYQPLELPIGNQTVINARMVLDTKTLQEVVITGYGEQDRKTLTSAQTSVSAKAIENLPTAGTDQLLQGRASGVQVSSNSGTPGGGVSVRIRGTSSINGSSDPLYVVDGIPIQANNLSGVGVGGGTTSPIADINPADIESMEILKDASATAIYGARAANGVVLITTKRGGNRKAKINFGYYYGTQEAARLPDVVDGPTNELLQNEAATNNWIDSYGSITALNPKGEPFKLPYANPAAAINTDWSDAIFRTGIIQNYDIGVSGGNENIQYLVSANNFDQEGILKAIDFNRKTARINLDFFPVDKLKVGTSMLYANTKRNRLRNDDSIFGAVPGAFSIPTNLPYYNPDGSYTKFSIFENPLAAVEQGYHKMNTDRFLGSVYGEYEILQGLRLRSSFSIDFTNLRENLYDNSFLNNGVGTNGYGQSISATDNNWIQENVLSYQFGNESHDFNVLVGTTLQESVFDRTIATGTQFPSNDFKKVISAAVQNASAEATSWGIASLFTRINYDYKDRYVATVNVRRDASSRFSEDNRWGTFPSLALGWVVSEEPFFKGMESRVNSLKVRASYGLTGNQSGIANFQSLGTWSATSYADLPGISPFQLANPDLKWETTAQFNVGVDVGLFKDRLSITADYYTKNTTDLLLAVPLPKTSGFSSQVQNFGELQNKGVELGINVAAIQKEDFNWNINFNIAGNRNKMTKLAAPFNVYNRDIFRYEEGYPMYSFYFHEQTGVDPQTGAPIFADVNGDDTFDPNVDRKIVGDANPDFFGGLTNTINYKNFDLSFFFQYSYGNEQLNWNRFFGEHGGTRNFGFMGSQLDRWQKPGDNTMIPRMSQANYAANLRPSRFLEDGSYARLKNITLGYTLPSSIISKVGLSSVRVYLSGQNVLTFTDYSGLDPEITATASNALTQGIEFYSVPQPRVFMGGFNVTF
ncbi:SusC/RagA family TonB-linked outer membrane protein [Pontibacter arcticus]|uniref:TonB-dependent receptor n=1 Tax=Pontibacter arcticus TaxID=2080288 RepID=A0A364RED7_9BACT|nr:TonB-dependent receptor [Pontibacter arcticus]RAU82536.1 TonB-dependent receptor [Pontibacter arcticus]